MPEYTVVSSTPIVPSASTPFLEASRRMKAEKSIPVEVSPWRATKAALDLDMAQRGRDGLEWHQADADGVGCVKCGGGFVKARECEGRQDRVTPSGWVRVAVEPKPVRAPRYHRPDRVRFKLDRAAFNAMTFGSDRYLKVPGFVAVATGLAPRRVRQILNGELVTNHDAFAFVMELSTSRALFTEVRTPERRSR